MRNRQIRRYWLLGAAVTTALFALLTALSNFRFENSDDAILLHAFMGFEGTTANFTLYTHTLLAYMLSALGKLWPGMAWYSLFQLGLLWVSGVVLVKCMAQLAGRRLGAGLWGAAAGTLLLIVFVAFSFCRISYTTTAAAAGAAAVAQALTADMALPRRGSFVRAWLGSLLLLLGAYSLRMVSILPPLAFLLLVFVWQLIRAGARRETGTGNERVSSSGRDGEAEQAATGHERKRLPLRSFLFVLTAYMLVFGGFTVIRQAEITARGVQPYLDWQNARIQLMDYTNFQTEPVPALAADSGLTGTEVEMVRQWYFLDGNITTEVLQTLAAAYPAQGASGAFASGFAFLRENPRYLFALGIVVLLCGFCWLGKREKAVSVRLAATAALLGTVILLLYLGWRGRLIARAADSVLMPAAALLFGLALRKEPGERRGKRIAALIMALLLLVATGLHMRLTYQAVTRAADNTSLQREQEIETYALQNPGLLIVRSPALLRDTRLFPDVSAGIPDNIILWGDWGCRTPSWNAQLARFGFDADAFTAADWLQDTIVFAAAQETDTDDLRAYLTDALKQPVTAEAAGGYGTLTFYRFTVTQEAASAEPG